MSITPAARTRMLRTLSNAILVAGLLASLVIYRTAATPADDPLGSMEDSKQSLREVQTYGGEANVLASEIRGLRQHQRRLVDVRHVAGEDAVGREVHVAVGAEIERLDVALVGRAAQTDVRRVRRPTIPMAGRQPRMASLAVLVSIGSPSSG